MPDFILEDDQTVPCAIVVTDDAGNIVAGAAADAGSIVASASDATILDAVVSPDQSSVQVTAVGPLATGAVVTLNGTVNGAAVTGSLAVDVVASAPAALGLIPGTPVAKPTPAPVAEEAPTEPVADGETPADTEPTPEG